MAETLARRDVQDRAAGLRPTYRTDRSFEWNHANGPDFDGPWPSVPPTPAKTVFGLTLNSRFGVPASILLNARWIGAYARLGFDLLTYKTVRNVQRLCHPVPNWLVADEASVAAAMRDPEAPVIVSRAAPADARRCTFGGSFGTPSVSPEDWRPDIAAAKRALGPGQALIVSVMGTARPGLSDAEFAAEFGTLAGIVAANGADIVEADLSCPNVARREGEVYLDVPLSARIAQTIRAAAGAKPVLLKTGDIADRGRMAEFLEAVAGHADGVVMINGPSRRIVDASGTPAFGIDRERAGVTGAGIKPLALAAVGDAVNIAAKRGLKIGIVGVGGVTSAADARDFLAAGAVAVQAATAAAWNPMLACELKTTAPEI